MISAVEPSVADTLGGPSVEAARIARAGWVRDLNLLVRPRIAVMVLATVVAAAWLTQGVAGDPLLMAGLLVGTALVAASSSVANQVLERGTDRLMDRTRHRPVAAGRLGVTTATAAAAVTLAAGTWLVVMTAGWPAASAAVLTWVVYICAYTPLKRVTPLNTAVGAVAGALPVAIGWLAADGPARFAAGDSRSALAVAALATVLYLWQFPHFMAIAWLYRRQYAAAGLRMLTVVDDTGLRAAGQSLAASLAFVPASLVLAVPSGSVRFFLSAALLSITYALATMRFAVRRDTASARLLLLASLVVLFGLLVAAGLFGAPSSIPHA
ncbi:MAG: protoheme IX farnesyltransferase [Planctomycetaceae bacterium]